MRTMIGPLLAMWAAVAATWPAAAAEELVVDLSSPVVSITTGFTGTDLVLFGVAEGPGDIVVVVRGPFQPEIVRKKERVAGVWVNRDEITFLQVPSFYGVAASRGLVEFAPVDLLLENRIGLQSFDFQPEGDHADEDVARFREALIRNKGRQGLYTHSRDPGALTFIGKGLFRTDLHFPANVAIGNYGIDVFLFRDRELVSRETTLLSVRKFGFEAGVFDFAYRHAFAYGVLAILIAAVAGWLANVMFRQG
ncbi:MAG: TIGR02186 family protein [Rhodospirillales bacterium]